jgi:CHAT domain-containing protein
MPLMTKNFLEKSRLQQNRHVAVFRVPSLLVLILALCFSTVAFSQAGEQGLASQTKEYFNQQNPFTALVIRLDPLESEFTSRVYGPDNQLIIESAILPLRMGPVFQFIESVDKPRQLRMELTFGHGTDKADLDIHLVKLTTNGPDNGLLTKAYRLFAFGHEVEPSNGREKWTLKVISLKQSANIFNELGMLELELWAEYYAHYFMLTRLADPITAAEGAVMIQKAATRSRMRDLSLAALQLEGAATVAQAPKNDSPLAKSLSAHGQSLLQQAAEMAASMGLNYEQARAIYHSGLAFEDTGQSESAFQKFDQAIAITSAAGDEDFANTIRKHAAELHEELGNNAAAIDLMREINSSEPSQADVPDNEEETEDENNPEGSDRPEREMAHYLFEQGRLLEKTFRHQEAVEVLQQALVLDSEAPSSRLTGPAGLLLGKALYGAGAMPEALKTLQESVEKTPAFRYEDELEEAFAIIANIHRHRGEFESMATTRKRHSMFITQLPDQAMESYEKALDTLATNGASSGEAKTHLRQSIRQASESGAKSLEQLARLQLCLLGDRASPSAGSCTDTIGRDLYESLKSNGLPAVSMQAGLLWSQMLYKNGRKPASMATLDDLIEDIQLLHSQVPGVMGAWYWQNRQQVFGSFMDQALEQATLSANGAQRENRALKALLSLDQLRAQQTLTPAIAAKDTQTINDHNRLRSLIADRQEIWLDGSNNSSTTQLDEQINELVAKVRNGSQAPAHSLSSNEALSKIGQLSPNEALVAYYLSTDKAYIWLGRNSSLSLISFPWSQSKSADFSRELEALRWDSSNNQADNFSEVMDRLGRNFLSPIAKQLPGNIYFLPIGRLEGFPLDALRWKGQYLAENHRVTNLLSLSALGDSPPLAERDRMQRVFLAGNRLEGAGDFSSSQTSSAEIRSVADIFIGPGLSIIQGAALQWDEFQDDRFFNADAIHLAVPALVDLRTPANSHLLMSDNYEAKTEEYLKPIDIASMNLKAQLAVLSASDFTGTNESAFDLNSWVVRDFLDANAATVLASLWPVGDARAAGFMQRFYGYLENNPDVSQSLSDTKKSYLENDNPASAQLWAAFQIFVN